MRFFVTAVVLAGSLGVIAQTTGVNPPAQQPTVIPQAPNRSPRTRQAAPPGRVPRAGAATVAASARVVVLKGVCKEQKAEAPCETGMTREQLDRLVDASAPGVSKAVRARQALQDARTFAFSALAEQQGLAGDPAVARDLDAQLKLVRMRVLADAFLERMRAQAPRVTEAEIQKYYSEHRDQYEQAQVRRAAVPLAAQIEGALHLDRSAVKSEMEALRKRAVAGEDLNQLQQDAFKHLHILATPPPVNVVTLRRGAVQTDESVAFDLNPGEFSAVLDLSAAVAVVKLESKGLLPIESVRLEIEAALRRDLLQNEVSKHTKNVSAQLNLQYFELSSQPDIFGVTASLATNQP